MMVLHPELPEAQIRETINRARRLIEGMGAEVHQIDEWGMRALAYPIRKLNRGYYVVTEYSAEPKVVNEFERTMKLADEILRYISVARSNTRRRASASTVRPVEPESEPLESDAAPEAETVVRPRRTEGEAYGSGRESPDEAREVEGKAERQSEAGSAAEETEETGAETPQKRDEGEVP
jgi:small subunit ribosomal protein S6